MTTPNINAGTGYAPGPYAMPVNWPNGATTGTGEMASWDETQWRNWIGEIWQAKFEGIGLPIEVLREWVHALAEAFKGNFAPLSELLEETITGLIPDFGPLIDAFQGEYAGDNPALLGIQSFMTGLSALVDAVQNFVQGLVDAILRAIRGIPVVGGTLAEIIEDVGGMNDRAVTAQSTAVAAQTAADDANYNVGSVVVHAASLQGQVNSLNSLLYRSNRSLMDGLISNGESTFYHWMLGLNPTTITATPTSLPWAQLRTESDAVKNLIAFFVTASTTPSLTAVYADIYVWNEDGTKSYFQSVDFLGQLNGSAQWITFNTGDLDVGEDATIGVQIRCVGSSGSVVIKALDLTTTGGIPGIVPGNIGMIRTTNNAPTTVAANDGTYTGKAIYLEYGNGESGAVAAPPLDFYDGLDANSGDWQWSGEEDVTPGHSGGPTYEPNSGYDMKIQNGRMEYTYSGFGAAVGYRGWAKQTRRNSFEFSFRIGQTKNLYAGAMLNHGGTIGGGWSGTYGPNGPFVLIGVKSDTLAIMTATGKETTSFTTRSSVAITNPADRWIVTYSEDDNTYRVFRDGNSTPLVTWADTANSIPGRRRVALFNTGQLFGTGSWIDDPRLRDTYTV